MREKFFLFFIDFFGVLLLCAIYVAWVLLLMFTVKVKKKKKQHKTKNN